LEENEKQIEYVSIFRQQNATKHVKLRNNFSFNLLPIVFTILVIIMFWLL